MINSPTANTQLQVIAEVAPTYTVCSIDITDERREFCKACPQMTHENDITRCSTLALDVNLIITSTEIACPEGNW
jgi:glycerol-3-phosphate cytidylyltransferase-like family protein